MFKNEEYSSFLNIFTKNIIYNLIIFTSFISSPLSYTITGGAARHEKVKPKTWRISASADATWYLRLQVFTTDQPRCYAFDKVLRLLVFLKKNYGFLFSEQNLHEKFFFFAC